MTEARKPDERAPASAGATTAPAVKTPDVPKSDEAAKPAAQSSPTASSSTDPNAAKPADAETADQKAAREAAEFEAALKEPNKVKVDEKTLDALDPNGSNAGLADGVDDDPDYQTLKEQSVEATAAMEELATFALDVFNPATDDQFILFGYGGKTITIGLLRKVSRFYRLSKAYDDK